MSGEIEIDFDGQAKIEMTQEIVSTEGGIATWAITEFKVTKGDKTDARED